MKLYLAVMLGGALGSGARLWLSGWMAHRFGETFPIGTLVVNVSGCLAIGLVAGLTGPQGIFLASPVMRQMVMVGILGGFTTFSSFGLQTFALVSEGDWFRAGLNVVGSVVLCLLAVWLGHIVAAWIQTR